jgi:hypothetical protein
VYVRALARNALLVVLVIVIIDNRNSLVLLGGLDFPVFLSTSWLLGRRAGVLAIVRVTRLRGIVLGTFVFFIIFFIIFLFVVSSIFGLSALGLLLWR